MQIILLENILKLGKIGDLVEVKNGYGRNFLLRNGKALRANKENIELVSKKKDELNKKNNEFVIRTSKFLSKGGVAQVRSTEDLMLGMDQRRKCCH